MTRFTCSCYTPGADSGAQLPTVRPTQPIMSLESTLGLDDGAPESGPCLPFGLIALLLRL